MGFLPAINGLFEDGQGEFILPRQFGMDRGFQGANQVFAERMQQLGNYKISSDSGSIISYQEEAMEEEAYRLLIKDEKIIIYASGEKGYYYGLTTLYQMAAMGQGKVKNCTISDKPRMERRGVMLDVCRHFFMADEVKKIIEQSALLKMNQFHWKLSEDQGFRIESTRFPELNKISSYRNLAAADQKVLNGLAEAGDSYGGYYTKEEIRDVVSFAKARQVEVIPEISMPGHSSAILAAFPEFTCTGKPMMVKNTFGIHERIFCSGNEAVFEFLYQLLDEVCELFPSSYIHLGGDEAPKTAWKSCPACNKVMEEKGLKSYEQLQTYFSGKVIEHIKKNGKTPIVWNESAIAGNLDEKAVIQYWIEMAPGPSYVTPELEKGRKVLLSSMNQFYCDYSYAEIPLRATLLYEPEIKGTKVPMENVLGIEAPMWTEWTPENKDIEKMMYPRLLAVAECGWTHERDWADFSKRAKHYLSVNGLNLLKPMPWEDATIHGQDALEMIAQKMLELAQKYENVSRSSDDEEAGKAEAVLPEDSQPLDMAEMMRSFMEDKMKAAYTQEEIEQVLQIMAAAMNGENIND
ncbi:MAG: beta-N-acetylhexosaminidase [Lachnospiraceae bacterium]